MGSNKKNSKEEKIINNNPTEIPMIDGNNNDIKEEKKISNKKSAHKKLKEDTIIEACIHEKKEDSKIDDIPQEAENKDIIKKKRGRTSVKEINTKQQHEELVNENKEDTKILDTEEENKDIIKKKRGRTNIKESVTPTSRNII